MSYLSLVYRNVFDSFFIFVIFLSVSRIKFYSTFNLISLKKIIKFSTYQFLFSFVNYFSRNMDNLLVGRYLGPTSLAFYDKSYQLMLMPVQNLTNVITPVLHPVLSTIQSDKPRILKIYLGLIRLLGLLGFPLSVYLYFSSNELILFVYGSQWLNSVSVFRALSLSVGFQVVLSSVGSIFQVINRTDLLFYTGVVSSIFIVSSIVISIFIYENLEIISYGLVIAFLISFVQVYFVLFRYGFQQPFFLFIKCNFSPLIYSTLLAFVFLISGSFEFLDGNRLLVNTSLYALFLIIVFKRNRQLLEQTLSTDTN